MTNNGNIYSSEEGKLIVRKSDNFIMGDTIDLGSADSIDNYEEREFTQEEIDSFNETYGIKAYTQEEGDNNGVRPQD